MSLVCLQSRAARFTYDLATVTRSVGYLQGGYKDAVATDIFQLFNTITEVGTPVILNTGFFRSYVTGVSGNFIGWYTMDNNSNMQRWSYVTSSGAATWVLPAAVSVSAQRDIFWDVGFYGRGTPVNQPYRHGPSSGVVNEMYKTNQTTETHYRTSGGDGVRATSRQGAGSTTHAWFTREGTAYNGYRSYNLDNDSGVNGSGSSPAMGSMQIECLANRSSALIHMIGRTTPNNIAIRIDGPTVLGSYTDTSFGWYFGESHSLTSDVKFFMMAGYNDNSGRYGGSQHALCESYTFANASITTLPDLIKTQSSGQMIQGF